MPFACAAQAPSWEAQVQGTPSEDSHLPQSQARVTHTLENQAAKPLASQPTLQVPAPPHSRPKALPATSGPVLCPPPPPLCSFPLQPCFPLPVPWGRELAFPGRALGGLGPGCCPLQLCPPLWGKHSRPRPVLSLTAPSLMPCWPRAGPRPTQDGLLSGGWKAGPSHIRRAFHEGDPRRPLP